MGESDAPFNRPVHTTRVHVGLKGCDCMFYCYQLFSKFGESSGPPRRGKEENGKKQDRAGTHFLLSAGGNTLKDSEEQHPLMTARVSMI